MNTIEIKIDARDLPDHQSDVYFEAYKRAAQCVALEAKNFWPSVIVSDMPNDDFLASVLVDRLGNGLVVWVGGKWTFNKKACRELGRQIREGAI